MADFLQKGPKTNICLLSVPIIQPLLSYSFIFVSFINLLKLNDKMFININLLILNCPTSPNIKFGFLKSPPPNSVILKALVQVLSTAHRLQR